MKKYLVCALTLLLTLSLTACGKKAGGSNPTSTPGNSTAPSASPTASAGGDTTPSASGGFKNLTGGPLTLPETAPTIEAALGVSAEGSRIVKQYTEKLFDGVWKPDGCTAIYIIYEFDTETGEVSDCSLWYGGFTDETLFRAAFQEVLDHTFENNIRGYNVSGGYFGFYTLAAFSDRDNDGVLTWDDAVGDGEFEDDINYILIQ